MQRVKAEMPAAPVGRRQGVDVTAHAVELWKPGGSQPGRYFMLSGTPIITLVLICPK